MEKGVVVLHVVYLFIRPFRIAYSVYILEKLKQMYPDSNIQVMYDIACVLVKHLKVCL